MADKPPKIMTNTLPSILDEIEALGDAAKQAAVDAQAAADEAKAAAAKAVAESEKRQDAKLDAAKEELRREFKGLFSDAIKCMAEGDTLIKQDLQRQMEALNKKVDEFILSSMDKAAIKVGADTNHVERMKALGYATRPKK